MDQAFLGSQEDRGLPMLPVEVHAFNPITQEVETDGFLESEAILIYMVSSTAVRAA